MNVIEDRRKSLGLELPTPVAPVANYVPWVVVGKMLYMSGQLPLKDGKLTHDGIYFGDLTVEQRVFAARQCAINLIAQMRVATGGDLTQIRRIVKLIGFVSSHETFKDHPKVVNGASDLMVEVFGKKGCHARSSVGVSSLPLGSAVEVEAIVELE